MWAGVARSAIDFLKREDGPTAVEYAIMLALIIVVSFVVIATIGTNANSHFGNVALQAATKTTAS